MWFVILGLVAVAVAKPALLEKARCKLVSLARGTPCPCESGQTCGGNADARDEAGEGADANANAGEFTAPDEPVDGDAEPVNTFAESWPDEDAWEDDAKASAAVAASSGREASFSPSLSGAHTSTTRGGGDGSTWGGGFR